MKTRIVLLASALSFFTLATNLRGRGTAIPYQGQLLDASVRHIGPLAQDFRAAFGLGSDDKFIAFVDGQGVALAAIQRLNQKLNEKEAEIQNLKENNGALAERLNELEATVKTLTERNHAP
jgi:hypothetical protein